MTSWSMITGNNISNHYIERLEERDGRIEVLIDLYRILYTNKSIEVNYRRTGSDVIENVSGTKSRGGEKKFYRKRTIPKKKHKNLLQRSKKGRFFYSWNWGKKWLFLHESSIILL